MYSFFLFNCFRWKHNKYSFHSITLWLVFSFIPIEWSMISWRVVVGKPRSHPERQQYFSPIDGSLSSCRWKFPGVMRSIKSSPKLFFSLLTHRCVSLFWNQILNNISYFSSFIILGRLKFKNWLLRTAYCQY